MKTIQVNMATKQELFEYAQSQFEIPASRYPDGSNRIEGETCDDVFFGTYVLQSGEINIFKKRWVLEDLKFGDETEIRKTALNILLKFMEVHNIEDLWVDCR